MARKPPPTRAIRCYNCRHPFEVAQKAMTVSCPKCYKQLLVQDIVVNKTHSVRKLQTCGKILVEPRGHVIAQVVDAVEGIEVRGAMEAGAVTASQVHLTGKSKFKGDCRAGAIYIELGAQIGGGFFRIPDEEILVELGGARPAAAPQPKPGRRGKKASAKADEPGPVVRTEAVERTLSKKKTAAASKKSATRASTTRKKRP